MRGAGLLVGFHQSARQIAVEPQQDSGEQGGFRLRQLREDHPPAILAGGFQPRACSTGSRSVYTLHLAGIVENGGNTLAGEVIAVRKALAIRRCERLGDETQYVANLPVSP